MNNWSEAIGIGLIVFGALFDAINIWLGISSWLTRRAKSPVTVVQIVFYSVGFPLALQSAAPAILGAVAAIFAHLLIMFAINRFQSDRG